VANHEAGTHERVIRKPTCDLVIEAAGLNIEAAGLNEIRNIYDFMGTDLSAKQS
jgi:hypothetical protein